MYVVVVKMRFHKSRHYLCQNERGELFIGRAKIQAVKFATLAEANEGTRAVNHRDAMEKTPMAWSLVQAQPW